MNPKIRIICQPGIRGINRMIAISRFNHCVSSFIKGRLDVHKKVGYLRIFRSYSRRYGNGTLNFKIHFI